MDDRETNSREIKREAGRQKKKRINNKKIKKIKNIQFHRKLRVVI